MVGHLPPFPDPDHPRSQEQRQILKTWIAQKRQALQRKMQREQDYLDRRARRGTRTPTDEAYEQDQILEADLLALLDALAQRL